MIRILIVSAAVLLAASANADEQPRKQRMMVIHRNVEIGVDNAIGSTLAIGRIVEVSNFVEGFWWVPALRGWVPSADVVPVAEAERFLTEQIEKSQAVDAFVDRGIARFATANYEGAEEDLSNVIRMRKDDRVALTNRGRARLRLRKYEQAVEDFESAIAMDSSDHVALTYLGVSLAGLGQMEAAYETLGRALTVKSSYVPAWNNRGVIHRVLGRLNEAESDFSRVLELDPGNTTAHSNRAFVRSRLGKYEDALSDYDSALERSDSSREISCDLAWFLATCPDDAVRDGERALKLIQRADDGKDAEFDVLDAKAASLAELGQFEQAVETIGVAIVRAPEEMKPVLEARRELYQKRQPFRMKAVTTTDP